jgi:acyl-CoA thioester hydrolase
VNWNAEPVESGVLTVREDWIDYNGHLNMAYYNVLFDQAVDQVFDRLGLGPDYVATRGGSFFTAEAHVCYLRELSAGMNVIVTLQLVDLDSKRAHFYQELRHAEEGWLSATCEQLSLHVDMATRKVAPWPEDIHANLAGLATAHAGLPRPARAGRQVGIRRKS